MQEEEQTNLNEKKIDSASEWSEYDFQRFDRCGNMFVSEDVRGRLNKDGLIYKYIPIDNFLDSFHKKYIYLSSPKKWEDPYELKYVKLLEGIGDAINEKMKRLKVYAICFSTSTKHEEALWKGYKAYGDNFVRLAIHYDRLIEQLRNDRTETYFTAMKCITRSRILEEHYVNIECPEKELFLQNFSLKQNAYSYEKEIRLCAFDDGEMREDYMKIEDFDWKTAIKSITFPPYNKKEGENRGLFDMYYYYLTEKLGFQRNDIYICPVYMTSTKYRWNPFIS